MGGRMVTLHLDVASADLATVKARYALGADEVDDAFGVVCVSPERQLYAVLLSEAAADRVEGAAGVEGVYANPRIETFGPPR